MMNLKFWRRKRRDEELDAEIQSHLEMAAREHVERGETSKDAELAARRQLGNVALVKEVTRDSWGWRWLADLLQDLRYGARTLQRNPAFTIVAVLTLALGIGANTAIFSLINAAVLKILPVRDAEQLVQLQNAGEQGSVNAFSFPEFAYMRTNSKTLGLAAYADTKLNFSAGDISDQASGLFVSDNYFSMLGVRPRFGRGFVAGDETVAILSYRFWRTHFGSDPTIVGKSVNLNEQPFTVAGIAPQEFFGVEVGSSPDIFVPLAMRDRLLPGQPMLTSRNNFWLTVVGRLQPGANSGQAQVEAEVLYHQADSDLTAGLPASNPLVQYFQSMHASVTSGAKGISRLHDEFGKPLLVLMAAVGLVLLIGCANIASLLLARASGRRREVGIRLAVGAGRSRLFRQFLTESLLLATIGGALGLIFALWFADGMVGILTGTIVDTSPDLRVLMFTLGISLLTGVIFGTIPAIQATYISPISALKNEGQAAGAGRRFGLKNLLVAGQVAVSLVLLIGAGLFVRTLANLKNQDMGFRPDHVLLASFNPELNRYTPERTDDFYAQLLEQVRAIPGTLTASYADQPLLAGAMFDGLTIEGRAKRPNESLAAAVKIVSPQFFQTMGISIKSGRDFTTSDRKGAPRVAIINEKLAKQFFGGQNPIGKHIGVGTTTADLEIVGLIADTKYRSVRNAAPRTVYLPIGQMASAPASRTLHVRTFADTTAMTTAIRDRVRQIAKDLPLAKIEMFSQVVDENLVQERLIAGVSGLFGVLAVVLACMGLYGVMSYAVARRTNEIGIRMALGARPANILSMVLKESLLLAAVGVALGIPMALWATRIIQKFLFGIGAADPLTITGAAVLMILVTAIAGFVPARRAMRVDPMVALRNE